RTLLREIVSELEEYAHCVAGVPKLRRTVILNALVGLDNGLCILYAKRSGTTHFDDLIPVRAAPAIASRQRRLALAPTFGFDFSPDSFHGILQEGPAIVKVKIGNPGAPEEMLAKDQEQLARVHSLVSGYSTQLTDSGRIGYYLDANGRYN